MSISSSQNIWTARFKHTAVWTGSRMLILWGLSYYDNSSGADYEENETGGFYYEPGTDTWGPIAWTGQPSIGYDLPAVWTGSHLMVQGGLGQCYCWNGYSYSSQTLERSAAALYNPVTDVWTTPAALQTPGARYGHSAVWTGTDVIFFGGRTGSTSLSEMHWYQPY